MCNFSKFLVCFKFFVLFFRTVFSVLFDAAFEIFGASMDIGATMDFTMDKVFYDIEQNDLKELWDSDLDPVSFFFLQKNLLKAGTSPLFAELLAIIKLIITYNQSRI